MAGSETHPMMNSLREKAATFIDLFDSRHFKIKTCVHKCQHISKVVVFTGGLIVGIILGLCVLMEDRKSQKKDAGSRLDGLVVLVIVIVLCVIFGFREAVDINLYNGEFKKSVFPLAVELGKLKQRCEDVKGSLGSGVEKENLERLEESIEELLGQMESLTDTVSLPMMMDDGQKEYETILHELDKMKFRLSFYRGTIDEKKNTETSSV